VARVRLGGFLHSPFATPSGALASQGPSARCDAQRVELSDPPACDRKILVLTKYWCLPDAIGHAKPIITDGKRVSSGHMGMWLINLLIAIAAWIAVCAAIIAIIKLVEVLP
jgi:hypothetical protein